MTNKLWDSYKRPTPIKFRKLGDALLVLSMSASGTVMGLPISDNAKAWTIVSINFVGGIGKFLTNLFKSDEESKPVDAPQ